MHPIFALSPRLRMLNTLRLGFGRTSGTSAALGRLMHPIFALNPALMKCCPGHRFIRRPLV